MVQAETCRDDPKNMSWTLQQHHGPVAASILLPQYACFQRVWSHFLLSLLLKASGCCLFSAQDINTTCSLVLLEITEDCRSAGVGSWDFLLFGCLFFSEHNALWNSNSYCHFTNFSTWNHPVCSMDNTGIWKGERDPSGEGSTHKGEYQQGPLEPPPKLCQFTKPTALPGVPVFLFLSLFLFYLNSIQKTSKYVNEVLRCIYMRHRFEFCLKSIKEGVGSIPISEKWEEFGEGLCSSLNCWRRDSKSYGKQGISVGCCWWVMAEVKPCTKRAVEEKG